MRRRILASALALCMMFSLTVTASAVDGEETSTQETVNVSAETTNYTIDTPTKLVVSSDITLTGSGDAFEINADTTLVFEDGASLTLSGYTNGFVVENATVTSANMDITAASQMDVFRLRNAGGLSLSGNNSIQGSGKEGTTNRAIVLEGGGAQPDCHPGRQFHFGRQQLLPCG
mgnify:CR=1 FL=1